MAHDVPALVDRLERQTALTWAHARHLWAPEGFRPDEDARDVLHWPSYPSELTPEDLARVEAVWGHPLPADLRAFLTHRHVHLAVGPLDWTFTRARFLADLDHAASADGLAPLRRLGVLPLTRMDPWILGVVWLRRLLRRRAEVVAWDAEAPDRLLTIAPSLGTWLDDLAERVDVLGGTTWTVPAPADPDASEAP